jgi:hypothetical protein
MRAMKITTETGSVYLIGDSGICEKIDKNGTVIDVFKPFVTKPVPDEAETFLDIVNLPPGDPVVGQRMYIAGLDIWWISTRVASIE